MNERPGEVLEVGVGTGLALPRYDPRQEVVGVDYSTEMLEKARARVRRDGLRHVKALRRMDARRLDFADASFDTVAAMHVLSVVPEPERVMAEIARVLRPGGRAVIVNHFKHTFGPVAFLGRVLAPFAHLIGWHSDFRIEQVLGTPGLEVASHAAIPPVGMMTLLVLEKPQI